MIEQLTLKGISKQYNTCPACGTQQDNNSPFKFGLFHCPVCNGLLGVCTMDEWTHALIRDMHQDYNPLAETYHNILILVGFSITGNRITTNHVVGWHNPTSGQVTHFIG